MPNIESMNGDEPKSSKALEVAKWAAVVGVGAGAIIKGEIDHNDGDEQQDSEMSEAHEDTSVSGLPGGIERVSDKE